MKAVINFKAVVCILFAAALASCGKDEEDPHKAQFDMVVTPDAETYNVAFYATAKKITINWGDGTTEEFNAEKNRKFMHKYSELEGQTISVKAEWLTDLDCYTGDIYGATFVSVGRLHDLDLKNCQDLKRLNCERTYLVDLDLTHCPMLTYLNCEYNQLEFLDITKNPMLNHLRCSYNHLTALDMSKNPKFEILVCDDNQLTSLDVSNNIALQQLYLGNNPITAMDISKNNSLMHLGIDRCNLSAESLNDIFEDLPSRKASDGARIHVFENPGTKDCNIDIARNKGWITYY